jgi:hypothetical protein
MGRRQKDEQHWNDLQLQQWALFYGKYDVIMTSHYQILDNKVINDIK